MLEDAYYIRPKTAWKKLSTALSMRAPAYLYGVTGIGKTTLVRDFLSRRRSHWYSAGEISPEQIHVAKEIRNQIFVIDDLYQVADPEEQKLWAKVIETLLERDDVWLVMISRTRMPGWLVPLYIQYTFAVIAEKDFYMDRETQKAWLEEKGLHLNEAGEEKAWAFTEGHPLSLRILTLTGGDTESAMKDLGNFFEVAGENGIWKYRWQMRQTLVERLKKKYSREKIQHLYYHAGLYYEMHDQIARALEMYARYGDSESISRVLIANARKNPATGHYFELRRYYLALPEAVIKDSPVLMAGMSMLQSILMNDEESERWYGELEEYARSHNGSERREAKSRLLYLDIGLPHRGSVNLVDIFKHAGTLLRERGAALPELSVTTNLPSQMNGGKDFCEWSRKDKELAASIGKVVSLVLGKYGKALVPLALAESYFEKGMDNFQVMSLAEKGKMAAESVGKTEQSFVAAGILTWLSVFNGNADYGEEQLLLFKERAQKDAPNLLPNLEAFLCRIWLYEGKHREVMAWMEKAPNEAEDYHFVRLLTREGSALWQLLQNGELQWKNPEFKDQVIQECRQMAQWYPRYLDTGAAGDVQLPENARKILKLQAEGLSVREICETLDMKEATVKYHIRETYRKLGVKSRTGAVNEARKRQLI